ncbi:MAG: hypothetical protein SGPRY_014244, partial [Prymnesium sp.]
APGLTSFDISGYDRLQPSTLLAVGSSCRGLTHLSLAEAECVTDDCLTTLLSLCPRMASIDLSWCGEISSACVNKLLGGWEALHTLELHGCEALMVDSLSFSPSPPLIRVDLSRSGWGGDGEGGLPLSSLAGCSTLQHLNLGWLTEAVTDELASMLLSTLPQVGSCAWGQMPDGSL